MIIFENEGLLDIRALKTMGVSVKSEGAIGYFGTGLKYAIAVLLRTGHEIKVYIDAKPYEFSFVNVDIKGQPFNIVTMNGEELGFATDLGRNWETWMAFRELACNATDEGGNFYHSEGADVISNGKTIITVEGDLIHEDYGNRAEIFFQGKETDNEFCDIHEAPSSYIFYRGVRVHKLHKPSMVTYNIKPKMRLTEDRTLYDFYHARREISYHYLKEASTESIFRSVKANNNCLESELDYDYSTEASDDFIETIGKIVANKGHVPKSAKTKYRDQTGVEEVRVQYVLNEVQKKQMEKSILFLMNIEDNVDEYPIEIYEALGQGILGQADQKENKIYLSSLIFEQGTKAVASCILEEYYHLKHGFNDRTYDFQTFLFDKIMSMNESLLGEPI